MSTDYYNSQEYAMTMAHVGKQAGLEQGFQQGHGEGYREGYEAGVLAMQQQMQAKLDQLLAQCNAIQLRSNQHVSVISAAMHVIASLPQQDKADFGRSYLHCVSSYLKSKAILAAPHQDVGFVAAMPSATQVIRSAIAALSAENSPTP